LKTLHFKVPVQLLAAAADGAPRRLRIGAYGGGLMNVGGFGLIVVDLMGMQIPNTLPILADHRNELGSVIASGRPTTDGRTLTVAAELVAAAAQVVALIEGGCNLQSSIGADVGDSEYVRPGAKVSVNGRTLTAGADGFKLVKRSFLREVTVTPLGADRSTSVTLAAANAAGVSSMDKAFET